MNRAPKDGVYLDATLAVIGQQVEERIDERSRRRLRRNRIGAAALALATLTSTSVAAVALSGAAKSDAPAIVETLTVPAWIECVDEPGGPSYFSAAYRTPPGVSVDSDAACAAARGALVLDAGLADATPVELVVAAERVLSGAVDDVAASGDEPLIVVDRASFGPYAAVAGR